MLRAQGIKKRIDKINSKPASQSTLAPLDYILNYEYEKYVELCYWCYEKPKSKGEWLSEEIMED